MLDLAVDDRGEAVLRVARDVLPDVQHRPAGGVDERAALARQLRHLLDRDAERRQNHDVVGAERLAPFARIGEEPDAVVAQPVVDVRVVDDLAGQEDVAAGKPAPRLIGVVDRPIDAVAEAELAGEMEREPARRRSGSRWRGPRRRWRCRTPPRARRRRPLSCRGPCGRSEGKWPPSRLSQAAAHRGSKSRAPGVIAFRYCSESGTPHLRGRPPARGTFRRRPTRDRLDVRFGSPPERRSRDLALRERGPARCSSSRKSITLAEADAGDESDRGGRRAIHRRRPRGCTDTGRVNVGNAMTRAGCSSDSSRRKICACCVARRLAAEDLVGLRVRVDASGVEPARRTRRSGRGTRRTCGGAHSAGRSDSAAPSVSRALHTSAKSSSSRCGLRSPIRCPPSTYPEACESPGTDAPARSIRSDR